MKILISICTKDRDNLLNTCLEHLSKVALPDGVTAETCVVINKAEAAESTVQIVEKHSSARIPMFALLEPRAGIPAARNCGLRYASENDYTHIAFMDDDAFPDYNWLAQLASNMSDGVCAVSGPQIPIYPDNASRALIETGFFSERNLPNGATTTWAATNNVLVSLNLIRSNVIWFDEEFASSGGSDKLFFLQLCQHTKKRILWCSDAKVYEPVTSQRFTEDWMRSRAYRYGAVSFPIRMRVHGALAGGLFCLLRGSQLVCRGLAKRLMAHVGVSSKQKADCDYYHGLGFFGGFFKRFRMKKYV